MTNSSIVNIVNHQNQSKSTLRNMPNAQSQVRTRQLNIGGFNNDLNSFDDYARATPAVERADSNSLNRSMGKNLPSSQKSKTKNNFEIKQILKMNAHHQKMNS